MELDATGVHRVQTPAESPWGSMGTFFPECGRGPVAPISEVIACQSRWELVLSVAWTLHLKKSIDVGDINT